MQFWQISSIYLDKNQLNFWAEPDNDKFFFSFSQKKKTVKLIFLLPDCTFEISAKTILTKFLSFLPQSPGGMIKGTKNIQKTAKFRENVESNFKNCSICFCQTCGEKILKFRNWRKIQKVSEEILSHQRVPLNSQNAAETTLRWFSKQRS